MYAEKMDPSGGVHVVGRKQNFVASAFDFKILKFYRYPRSEFGLQNSHVRQMYFNRRRNFYRFWPFQGRESSGENKSNTYWGVRGVHHAGFLWYNRGFFEVPHILWDLLLFLQINRQILRLIFFGLEKELAVVGGLRFFQSPPFCIFGMQNIIHSAHGNRNRLFLHLEWFCCLSRSLPPEL